MTTAPASPLPCPRCGQSVEQDYYGPCDGCRQELCAAVRGEAREVGDTRFEPAMHVTPNAVAQKE